MLRDILFLTLLTACLWGCQQSGGAGRLQGSRPFIPVHLVFTGIPEDKSVEREIEKLLFCRDCLFIAAEASQSPYSLKIKYDRRMVDLKGMVLILLSGGLAALEVDFSYDLQVQVANGDQLLRKYSYLTYTREEWYNVFADIFNPWYDENGRSEEIFTELTNRFLCDVQNDSPLQLKASSND